MFSMSGWWLMSETGDRDSWGGSYCLYMERQLQDSVSDPLLDSWGGWIHLKINIIRDRWRKCCMHSCAASLSTFHPLCILMMLPESAGAFHIVHTVQKQRIHPEQVSSPSKNTLTPMDRVSNRLKHACFYWRKHKHKASSELQLLFCCPWQPCLHLFPSGFCSFLPGRFLSSPADHI